MKSNVLFQLKQQINREREEHREYIAEFRTLLRRAFYSTLGRRPPRLLVHLPGYVRKVQAHYDLPSKNRARAILAEVEGFDSWREAMGAAILQQTKLLFSTHDGRRTADQGVQPCSQGELK